MTTEATTTDAATTPAPSSNVSESVDKTSETSRDDAMPSDLTEEELAMLTPEERAIIEGKDEEGAETSTEDDEADKAEASDDDAEKAKAEAAAADEADDKGDETAESEAKAGDDTTEGTAWSPPEAIDLTELDQKLTDAEKARDEAFQQFEDGEIDDAAFKEALKAAESDLRTAEREKAVAESKYEADMQGFRDTWTGVVQDYAKSVPDLFGDDHADAYNVHVKQVNASDNPAIMALSMEDRLRVAHARYAAEASAMGKTVPDLPSSDPEPAKQDPAPAKTDEEKATEAALAAVKEKGKTQPAATLRDMPSEEAVAPDAGKYSAIDRVIDSGDVAKAEAMVAKMTEEEFDAYLRSA